MVEPIRVDLASPPDRERLVAQIMIGDEQWAEINQEGSIFHKNYIQDRTADRGYSFLKTLQMRSRLHGKG